MIKAAHLVPAAAEGMVEAMETLGDPPLLLPLKGVKKRNGSVRKATRESISSPAVGSPSSSSEIAMKWSKTLRPGASLAWSWRDDGGV